MALSMFDIMIPGIRISQSILGLSLAWPDHARLTEAMHSEWIEKCSKT